MATTFADLEARVRRDDVRWLKRATEVLLADRGLTVEPDGSDD
ncbi:hypothetical protein ACFQ1S_21180 [Kibdelosporangium lantanae]|uniref:Uncharacterized protein n=1 Tax=Kibdelosporangium lantanae TaxID=1497396 RepID=A0ABW3MB77_9PSEU